VLSVIVPVLNEANSIDAALSPLQPLRHRGHEVIVVDGGSVDGTIRRAVPLADQVFVATRGRANQMNAGARDAKGDVLLFLHADTRLPERADALIAEGLERGAQAWGRFDVRIVGRPWVLPMVAALMNLRSRWTGIATGDQAIFVTRAAFQSIGGVPALALMEDVAMSKQLKRISPPLCLRERVLTSGRRWEAHGAWRTIALMWVLRFAYFVGVSPDRLARLYYRSRSPA
jgi:rSAM/selenodomain-associated transferase 2